MIASPDSSTHLANLGRVLHDHVSTRDDLAMAILNPLGAPSESRVSRSVAKRLRAGIAALESWLRRVILFLALKLEHDLGADQRPIKTRLRPRRLDRKAQVLRMLWTSPPWSRLLGDELRARPKPPRPHWVPAAPLLARLAALRALIEVQHIRARRLAFHLARRRPGWLRARRYRGPASGYLFDPESRIIHDLLADSILEASRARPPPLGPRPNMGPRIRWL